jgi:glycine betaine transporter
LVFVLRSLRSKLRFDLFWVSLPICAAVAVIGVTSPDTLSAWGEAVTGRAFDALDWFFLATMSSFVLLALWLGLGRYGDITLGRPGEEPEFSVPSWLAMLFAAGMGVGLLFWGVAEPVTHFGAPPVGEPGTAGAAREAMRVTLFHWGLHAWAAYCIAALVIAYFGFRKGGPHLAGTPVRMSFRGRWVEPVAKGADLIAVLAVAFGVAGSASTGVLQVHRGLHVVGVAPAESTLVAMLIMAVLTVCYMTSAATSVDKGIRWLSNLNMVIALLLMAFLLLVGPTEALLRTFVTSLGDYASGVVPLSFRLFPYEDVGSWLHDWTMTNFVWWIAWAPFVGVFIARISRGRTIRTFVLGVVFVPTLFSVLWFAIFGGTALFEEMHGAGGIARLVQEDVTGALFAVFDRLPGSALLSGTAVTLVFIFLVTSLDSATFVLGMLTQGGDPNPKVGRKLSWGVVVGLFGAALVLSGNIYAVRAVAVTGAMPFTLILLLQAVALIRSLRSERARLGQAEPGPADAAGDASSRGTSSSGGTASQDERVLEARPGGRS